MLIFSLIFTCLLYRYMCIHQFFVINLVIFKSVVFVT